MSVLRKIEESQSKFVFQRVTRESLSFPQRLEPHLEFDLIRGLPKVTEWASNNDHIFTTFGPDFAPKF